MSALKHPWFLPFLLSPLGLLIPVAPRSGPLLVLLLGIAGIIHYIRHRPPLDWLKTKPMAALAAWLLYLLLTGFWSEVPERSFEQAFRLTLLAFFGLAGFSLIRALSETQKRRAMACMLPALIIGVITGCIYGLLQYTGPYIRILTDLIGTSPEFSNFTSHDNRLHIAKTMLLTNLAFFAVLPWLWKRQRMIAIAAYLIFFGACFNSDSQSSLVACVAGGLVFIALRISKNLAPKFIMVGIVASFLVVIPLLQSPYVASLQKEIKSSALASKASPNLRLKIYGFFGEQTLNKPILGHGLTAGIRYKSKGEPTDYRDIRQHVRTPHNIHLQVLFDTGFVGASLLLLALLWPIWRGLRAAHQPQAYLALLPICVVIAGTLFNFVIWRSWIPGAALIGLFIILLSESRTTGPK